MGYFRNSFLVTGAGLALGALLGWRATGSYVGMVSTTFIVAVLAILEVSVSFDNAVVNATVLRQMTPLWRHRFITWGIAIAVFGMRVVFPLVIVAIIAHIGPFAALGMAAADPDRYSKVLSSAHVSVSAFGGAFQAMVGLKYFFDQKKNVHWIGVVERPLTQLGRIEAAAPAGRAADRDESPAAAIDEEQPTDKQREPVRRAAPSAGRSSRRRL